MDRLGRDIDAADGGEENIFDQIANGVPVGKIVEQFDVSRRDAALGGPLSHEDAPAHPRVPIELEYA